MEKNKLALIVIMLCVISLLASAADKIATSLKSKDTNNNIPAAKISTSIPKNRITLLKFNGVIDSESASSYFSTYTTAQDIVDALSEIAKDDTVKGVVIKLNTPGGTVGMSQNLYDAIIKVREQKPVVISMDDVAASGGYYMSSAADRIFAQRGTLTGSIGVIFSTMDYHELLAQKLLITPNVIKSGKFKDVGSGLKPMSQEDRALLQNIIDESYDQFVADITKGRIECKKEKVDTQLDKTLKGMGAVNLTPDKENKVACYFEYKSVPKKNLSKENLAQYADGRVFTGTQAYKLGFVDGIGNIDTAHEAASKMAKERFKLSEKTLPLVNYTKSQGIKDYLFNSVKGLSPKKTSLDIEDFVPQSMKMAKQPLYLWE